MKFSTNSFPAQIQDTIDRFISLSQKDERIQVALLTGSYARGAADIHSDLDFCLIISTQAYEDFIAGKNDFISQLGELLFVEDFNHPNNLLFILSNGVECELAICSQEGLDRLYSIPYRVLLDKLGLFPEALFTPPTNPPTDQVETLHHAIDWFWHDFSHFITAFARGQLWWAAGQLEVLRRICLSLAYLQTDYSMEIDWDDPYFKVEKYLSVESLAPLQATFCPLDKEAMLQSARLLLRYYQALARPLAQEHGVVYPEQLESVMLTRFNNLGLD